MAAEQGGIAGIAGIAPRTRRSWEAVDLGFAMVRAWWRPVLVPWLAVALTFRVLIAGVFYRWPVAGNLLAWWLRPLFDCVALFLVERCFLGAPAGVAATFRALPRLVGGDLLGLLITRRLDLARSFYLPLGQVEGLRGRERRQRAVWLRHGEGHELGVALTFACVVMESGTALALAALLEMLVRRGEAPIEGLVNWYAGDGFGASGLMGLAVSVAAFCLIEPFYVAAGYSLYLSRRAWLEGWDVQHAFRRMAERLEARAQKGHRAGRAAALVPWVLVGSFLLAGPAAVRAAELPDEAASAAAVPGEAASAASMPDAAASAAAVPEEAAAAPAPGTAPAESPEQAIREVLRSEDFATRRRISRWKLREGWWSRLPRIRFPDLSPAVLALRWTLLALAVLLAAGLAAWLARAGLRVWRRWRAAAPASPASPGPSPRALPGLLFGRRGAEPLPDDVPAAAWELWERGEAAAALGLLYRGALDAALRRDRLPVAVSWTEEDCLRSLYPRLERSRGDYLARLTRAWQAAAYARRPPPAEEARTLCGLWSRHFGEPA